MKIVTKAFGTIVAVVLYTASHGAFALDVVGAKPSHVLGNPSSVPNESAIGKAIWAPGIDEGYVPQGITIAEGAILVSGYKSVDPKVGTGPCRIWQIDAQSGAATAQFDMPDNCGHAGGLVYLGGGILVVADTRHLYKIDMKKALAEGKVDGALIASLRLAGDLKGSFIDFQGASLFIGSSEKSAEKATGHYLPLTLFDTHNGKVIREDAATSSFKIATDAQGAAFDKDGHLWLTFSNSKFGLLQKVDPKSGQILAQHEMVIGIEDIGFDPQGRLWAVSEAGALRWSKWHKTFPLLFQIDITKLK